MDVFKIYTIKVDLADYCSLFLSDSNKNHSHSSFSDSVTTGN